MDDGRRKWLDVASLNKSVGEARKCQEKAKSLFSGPGMTCSSDGDSAITSYSRVNWEPHGLNYVNREAVC